MSSREPQPPSPPSATLPPASSPASPAPSASFALSAAASFVTCDASAVEASSVSPASELSVSLGTSLPRIALHPVDATTSPTRIARLFQGIEGFSHGVRAGRRTPVAPNGLFGKTRDQLSLITDRSHSTSSWRDNVDLGRGFVRGRTRGVRRPRYFRQRCFRPAKRGRERVAAGRAGLELRLGERLTISEPETVPESTSPSVISRSLCSVSASPYRPRNADRRPFDEKDIEEIWKKTMNTLNETWRRARGGAASKNRRARIR